jgi:hypothetical protein
VERTLTAVELEMMNLTGDGNGIDLVTMPQEWRERVPTAELLPARRLLAQSDRGRAGTVAGLFAAIEAKMDRASQQDGARELARRSKTAGRLQACDGARAARPIQPR